MKHNDKRDVMMQQTTKTLATMMERNAERDVKLEKMLDLMDANITH